MVFILQTIYMHHSLAAFDEESLFDITYDNTYKVPEGFVTNILEDVIDIVWVTKPAPSRLIEGAKMNWVLVHKNNLGAARKATKNYFTRAIERDQFIPYLASYNIVKQQQMKMFFEFQATSTAEGKVVSFRVWNSTFFEPTVGWLLPYPSNTGKFVIGKMDKNTTAHDISLFLQYLWWDDNHNTSRMKVLELPVVEEKASEVKVSMQTIYFVHGDFNIRDNITHQTWSLTLDRITGDVVREITTQQTLEGKMN